MEKSKPSARVDTHTIWGGDEIATVVVRMHRFILAEFNTHRRFSRNSASSRAIPIRPRLKAVLFDLAWPIHWGANQKGMSAKAELAGWRLLVAKLLWKSSSLSAVIHGQLLNWIGLHKQVTNRILEPYLWHDAVVTATEWENFFAQRDHPDAQPEMRALAEAMKAALQVSTPIEQAAHTPFLSGTESILPIDARLKLSVARAARSSYNYFSPADLQRERLLDYERYYKLATATPPHASPFEHVALHLTYTPLCQEYFPAWGTRQGHVSQLTANFSNTHWGQYRQSPKAFEDDHAS